MIRTNVRLNGDRIGPQASIFENDLRKMIVGQDEAVDRMVRVYQMFLAGMMAPGRPIGSFLFLGPTGSGKTRIVEAAAECLLRDTRAVTKIDCAEFQHSHEISKLIGSPPGYLGHRETRPFLSQEQLNLYSTDEVRLSFVLFDEIEKASDALWNLLLGILDKGTLTLGDNRKVSFTSSLIFMTSNLGATEMQALVNPKLGFQSMVPVALDSKVDASLSRAGVGAARRRFTPEFMNRLDHVVTFRPLGTEALRRIVDLELKNVQSRVFNATAYRPFVFKATEAAKDFLLREGTDIKYGARHLKRAIDRLVAQPLSNLIATGQVRGGDSLAIDFDPTLGAITFTREAENMLISDMLEASENQFSVAFRAAANRLEFSA
jgi:ATP-dependent Clp protease ATP-binding subunit ClpA